MLAHFANEPFNTAQIPPEVEVHFKGKTPRRLSDHTIVIPEIFYLQPDAPGNLIARPSVLVKPDKFVFEPGQEVLVYKIAQHLASDRSSLISHYWLYIEVVVRSTGCVYVMEIISCVLNGKIYKTYSADTFKYSPYPEGHSDIATTGDLFFDNYAGSRLDSYNSVQMFSQQTMREEFWSRRNSFAKLVQSVRQPLQRDEKEEPREIEKMNPKKYSDDLGTPVVLNNYWRIAEFM